MVFKRQSRYGGTEDNDGSNLPRGRLGKKSPSPDQGTKPKPMLPPEVSDPNRRIEIEPSTDPDGTWVGQPGNERLTFGKGDPKVPLKVREHTDGGLLGYRSSGPSPEEKNKSIESFFPVEEFEQQKETSKTIDVKKKGAKAKASSDDSEGSEKKQQKSLEGGKIEDIEMEMVDEGLELDELNNETGKGFDDDLFGMM